MTKHADNPQDASPTPEETFETTARVGLFSLMGIVALVVVVGVMTLVVVAIALAV